MPKCKACDNDMEVKYVVPVGCTNAILENLCQKCLVWVDIARKPGPLKPPLGRRRPADRLYKDEEI